jgi:multidrug efflux pump subunit AcrA (membrane-fusion protein)
LDHNNKIKNKFEIGNRPDTNFLGNPPSWITQWGISYLFAIVLSFIFLAYLVKYPDVVIGKIIITSTLPPAKLVASTSAKIKYLYVKENSNVHINDVLMVLDNTANMDHIQLIVDKKDSLLFELIANVKANQKLKNKELEIQKNINYNNLQLGELQSSFANLMASISKYKYYLLDHSSGKQILSIQGQITDYNNLQNQIDDQVAILNQKVRMDKKKMDDDNKLAKEKIIPQQEADASAKKYYDDLLVLKNNQSTKIQYQLQSKESQKNIFQLEQSLGQNGNELKLNMQSAYEIFKSDVDKWEQKYVIKSPIDGKVSFYKFWSINQFVQSGEAIVSVVPEGLTLIGKAQIPIASSGKVNINQTVKIKIDNYPYQEFGMVTGLVSSISNIPQDNYYAVDISLPNGTQTTYKKKLPAIQELHGQVEIITQDLNLLQRFFNPIKQIFKN